MFKNFETLVVSPVLCGLLCQAAAAQTILVFDDNFDTEIFETSPGSGDLSSSLYFSTTQGFGGFNNGDISVDISGPGTLTLTADTVADVGFGLAQAERLNDPTTQPVLGAGFTARVEVLVASLAGPSFDADPGETVTGFGTRPGGLLNITLNGRDGFADGFNSYIGLRDGESPGLGNGVADLVAYHHFGNGSFKNGKTAEFIGFTENTDFGAVADRLLAVTLDETNIDITIADSDGSNEVSLIGGPQAHGQSAEAFGDDPNTPGVVEYGTFNPKLVQFHSNGSGGPQTTVIDAFRAFVTLPSGGLVGDYNSDGFVSQGDLDLVLLNWGDAVAPAGFDEGNLDGGGPFDGLMSQNELDGVLLNWGDGTPPALATIPEPATATLLGLGVFGLRRRRGGGV